MKEFIEKTKNDIEMFLREDMEHQNKEINFILYNPKTNETQVLVSDGIEEMILFAPYTKEQENGYMNVPEWDFNFDEYLFKELQNEYKIGYISNETHYGIWNTIDNLYPEDIDNIEGVRQYLQYCKDNKITKEYIDKSINKDTPNIMKFYKEPMKKMEDKNNDEPIKYFVHPEGSIFAGMKIRENPEDAFKNAIKRGMKCPDDWMYMYSEKVRDYFKHYDTRKYVSYSQFGVIENIKNKIKKSSERGR